MGLTFLHIPESILYVSEPQPRMFGNAANETNAGWSNKNWLKSRFHFSFAEYRNPKNSQFGCLRVMNDDLVQAHRGFGTHGHRDMEIVTYVVEGQLTHDGIGGEETLGRGSVQFMTAGTGIQHSEHNRQSSPLRFVQIWIVPREYGLPSNYGSFDGTTQQAAAARTNALARLVGDRRNAAAKAPCLIEQDMSLYVAELEPGKMVSLEIKRGRQAYLLCVEGALTASDADGQPSQLFARHDAAEIRGSGHLALAASGEGSAHLLVIEMAEGKGGREPGKWPLHLG